MGIGDWGLGIGDWGLGQVIPTSFYEAGYQNNGLMILPPMALILIGIIIWINNRKTESK